MLPRPETDLISSIDSSVGLPQVKHVLDRRNAVCATYPHFCVLISLCSSVLALIETRKCKLPSRLLYFLVL